MRWLMVIAVVAIGAIAYWQERVRSDAALDDLADEQAEVARAATSGLHAIDSDAARVIVVAHGSAHTLDGRTVAIDPHDRRLDRDTAAALGLPRRTAVIGFAPAPDGTSIGVAATAERQRDRQRAGMIGVVLSIVVAAGLVAAFGRLARNQQRARLLLAKDAELEQLSRAATIAALGSGVAHELSTPLGVIVGRAEQLLARAGDDPRIEKNARAIIDQAEHVDHVVRGLLHIARGAPTALQEVAPQRLVDETAALVAHRFARADVRLVRSLEPELPQIRCEPQLFEQALVTLLLNACEASRGGGAVELDVRARAGGVEFAVSDDGDNVVDTAIAPVFASESGAGLGLAIANEIASSHRGTLAIAARSPRGTCACIAIPAGSARG